MTGDHAGAITDYTEAIDSGLLSNRNGALAHCGRATARHLSGDSPGAVSDFTIALESGHLSDRAKAQARLARAGLLRQAGDHKGAITDFTEALDSGLLPGVAAASAQARRGDSRRLTDDFKGAIDDLTVALASKQLSPKIAPDAQRSLGNARLLLDGDARGALSDFIAAQDRLRVSRETAAEPQFGQADATPSSSNNPLANQSSRQLSSKRKADVQSGPPESRQRVGSHPDAIPHVVPGLNSGLSPALPRTAGQQGRDHARQPQTSTPDGVQAGAPGRAPQHRAPPSRGRGARGS
jgi:tetratricopeptide (TPR) repeat protein